MEEGVGRRGAAQGRGEVDLGSQVVDEGLLGDDGVVERWEASCLAPDQQWKEEVGAEPEDGISKRLR